MSNALKTAEEQFKKSLKGTKGVSVSRRKPSKFTEDQKKRIKKAQRQLRSK
jgi:hypothetical protein